MFTPKDARELDLEPQAPDPLPCPHCGKPLGGSASTSRAGCSGSPTSRVADRVSSGLRPRRRPARLQRRRRSAAPGSDGQARESTTRMQDAAINDPTCAAFVESYAPGRGIGLFIHGVFCQVVLNKWDCGGSLGPKQSTGPWTQEDPSRPGLRARVPRVGHAIASRQSPRAARQAGELRQVRRRGLRSGHAREGELPCGRRDRALRVRQGARRAALPHRRPPMRARGPEHDDSRKQLWGRQVGRVPCGGPDASVHSRPHLRQRDGARGEGTKLPRCGPEDLCGGDGARGGQDPAGHPAG